MTALSRLQSAIDALVGEVDMAIASSGLTLPSPTTMGALVCEARQARDMSLDDLAKRTGLSKSHIWEIEQDRQRQPTVATCHLLSIALGVPFLRMASAALCVPRRGANVPKRPAA